VACGNIVGADGLPAPAASVALGVYRRGRPDERGAWPCSTARRAAVFPKRAALGQPILILGLSFKVVGVLAPRSDRLWRQRRGAVTVARDRLFPSGPCLGAGEQATIYLRPCAARRQAAIGCCASVTGCATTRQRFMFQNVALHRRANNVLVGLTSSWA
jgi:hypothetical protein